MRGAQLLWFAVAATLLFFLLDVLLLVFAGILVAVFLRGLSDPLAKRTGLGPGLALAMVVVTLAGLLALGGWLAAPSIGRQIDQLIRSAPQLAEDATGWLESYDWGRWLLARSRGVADGLDGAGVMPRATALFGTTLGLFGSLFAVGFLGLFLAAEPRTYIAGLSRLAPRDRRARVRTLLADCGAALRAWLLAKVLSMAVIFTMTWLGLSLFGVPLAMVLALFAALLTFVPNFGPVVAAVPAVLLALQQGGTTALGVAGLYVGIQVVETYLVTPLVEKKLVAMPPAVPLVAQVTMGAVAGALGVVLATPLAVVALAIGRRLTEPDVAMIPAPEAPAATSDATG